MILNIPINPDALCTWIDHDNFVDPDGIWWQVEETLKRGRLRAFHYWVQTDEDGVDRIIKSRMLTTAEYGEGRPEKW